MSLHKMGRDIISSAIANLITPVLSSILVAAISYFIKFGTDIKLAVLTGATFFTSILVLCMWIEMNKYIKNLQSGRPKILVKGSGNNEFKGFSNNAGRIETSLPFIILLKGVYPNHNWSLEVESPGGVGIQLHKDITRQEADSGPKGARKRYKIEGSIDGIQFIVAEKVWIDTRNFEREEEFIVFKFKLYKDNDDKAMDKAEYELPITLREQETE